MGDHFLLERLAIMTGIDRRLHRASRKTSRDMDVTTAAHGILRNAYGRSLCRPHGLVRGANGRKCAFMFKPDTGAVVVGDAQELCLV